jgi:hypothetical protein
MGTKQLLATISLSELEQAFAIADEDIQTDISVIRISMIRDVHYDSIDLNVLVFGQEDGEEDAPVADLWIDPERIGTEDELNEEGISPCRLRALFSEDVLDLIMEKGVPIQWLCDDGYLLTLSLNHEDETGIRLVPVDR